VLITGHTGFKGSWLSLLLQSLGARISGVALEPESGFDIFEKAGVRDHLENHLILDIRNREELQRYIRECQPEVVFHLAAQPLVQLSYEDPHNTFSTNVLGSLNVLEAIRASSFVKALVYVTSDKCYKNQEWIWGYREVDELGGHDPYSASKAMCELLIQSYQLSYFMKDSGFGAASARAGNVIGGGDFSKDRIIPDCIRSIWSQEPFLYLRHPEAIRPWQHVLDPLFGYAILGAKLHEDPAQYRGAWNFGPTTSSVNTVRMLTERILSHWDTRPHLKVDDKIHEHETKILHLNCDKAYFHLGWKPVWDLHASIDNTALWYKQFLHDPEGVNMKDFTLMQINSFLESIHD
jgi:CDP-glucose 4,6-dehydratase